MRATNEELARARWSRIWRGLTSIERLDAAGRYIAAAELFDPARLAILGLLAKRLGTSQLRIAGWPIQERALRVCDLPDLEPPLIAAMVARFLIGNHRELVARFLDDLRIPHSGGEIAFEGVSQLTARSEAEIARAVQRLRVEHSDSRINDLFLDALDAQLIPCLRNLSNARRR
jgi:hypothetical protein